MNHPRLLLVASFAALAALLSSACGGGVVDPAGSSNGGNGSGGSGSSGGTTGTNDTGGDEGTSGTSGIGGSTTGTSGTTGTSSGSSSGGSACVEIDVTKYDVSCKQASDCAIITPGQICPGSCTCGGGTINVAGVSSYESAISSIPLGACGCPLVGSPECIDDVCTLCTGRPEDPPACRELAVDAGGACVNVDVSTYDTSCQEDGDCAIITAGTICARSCLCGGSAINTDGLGRYDTAIDTVHPAGDCPCAFTGTPRCVANRCTICGFGPDQPPGCPDGG